MKSVIWAAFIFIFIITAIIFSCDYVTGLTGEMLQILYENEKYIANNQWDEAKNATEQIEALWSRGQKLLSVIYHHGYVEAIDKSISNIKNTIKVQRKVDAFYENQVLIFAVSNLEKQQKISVENIF